jgi:hypothetical protein
MYGYIHLIALDCLLFFFFLLFDGLPGLTVCVCGGLLLLLLLVSGLYRPGFQEMKEACKVRDKSSRALPIICTHPHPIPPVLSSVPCCANPHTFYSCLASPFSSLSLSVVVDPTPR